MQEPQQIKVLIIKSDGAKLPEYQTLGAAGMDVHALIQEPLTISSLERKLIPTGIKLAIPFGYEMQVRPRSGLAVKHGVTVLNAPGTIDSDYRGEVMVLLVNLSPIAYTLQPGERIAQLVLAKHEKVEWLESVELDKTERGTGGFGSTGK